MSTAQEPKVFVETQRLIREVFGQHKMVTGRQPTTARTAGKWLDLLAKGMEGYFTFRLANSQQLTLVESLRKVIADHTTFKELAARMAKHSKNKRFGTGGGNRMTQLLPRNSTASSISPLRSLELRLLKFGVSFTIEAFTSGQDIRPRLLVAESSTNGIVPISPSGENASSIFWNIVLSPMLPPESLQAVCEGLMPRTANAVASLAGRPPYESLTRLLEKALQAYVRADFEQPGSYTQLFFAYSLIRN